ncbi:hypothetical protein M427DRAFT_65281 [Gonapodya prolifera JEL478]|uniref:Methyltransferase type 11 domain-containing protein n=1 Tax=Gonapodya prolifera (strain JEL478) TaxID=1344416 RepID=A0A139B0N1_GONPJ|nr:hypothetical protein M427DRAFT_65281 [Gonapodya prolifera JEL478]|eukprot:KXS22255.1 hypothetical protein M427DRAFT_65281 [Gonapodya prolifera JEL478]
MTLKREQNRNMPIGYETKRHWNKRFQKESHFEWLLEWDHYESLVLPYLTSLGVQKLHSGGASPYRVLHLGCGNSSLGVDFANWAVVYRKRASEVQDQSGNEAPFLVVTNVDFSNVVITNMKERYPPEDFEQHGVQLEWICGDARTLRSLPSDHYDLVIDKSCFDALVCGGREHARKAVRALQRVAKLDAVWVMISYSTNREEYVLKDAGDEDGPQEGDAPSGVDETVEADNPEEEEEETSTEGVNRSWHILGRLPILVEAREDTADNVEADSVDNSVPLAAEDAPQTEKPTEEVTEPRKQGRKKRRGKKKDGPGAGTSAKEPDVYHYAYVWQLRVA